MGKQRHESNPAGMCADNREQVILKKKRLEAALRKQAGAKEALSEEHDHLYSLEEKVQELEHLRKVNLTCLSWSEVLFPRDHDSPF